MEPPSPPLSPPLSSITRGDSSVASSKLRLLCSYGGRISPRPRGNPLCYVGGDTRLVVVDRTTSLHYLSMRLSHLFLDGRRFAALKYQLPGVDLDSLVTVATDDDLENMIVEYDRTVSSPSHRRLRLFLFPLKPESTQSTGPILQTLSRCEDQFTNTLSDAGSLTRRFSDSVSVNRLLGLDDYEHPVTDSRAPENSSLYLPPINSPVGIEDQFSGIKKQEDFPAMFNSYPSEKTAVSGGHFTAGTVSIEHPGRFFFDECRPEKVATFQMPSFSASVSDHSVEPKISSYGCHKPTICEVQNPGYSSQSGYEKQQSQVRSEHRQLFKTAPPASRFDNYQPLPRPRPRPHPRLLEHQNYPIYYTPLSIWPIHSQIANHEVYGVSSATHHEYSPQLVHVSADQGMQTVMDAASAEFPEASSSSGNVLGKR